MKFLNISNRTAKDYQGLLFSLLPPGKIWNKNPSSGLGKLLLSLAKPFVRIEEKANQVVKESLYNFTEELIEEHETEYAFSKAQQEKTIENRKKDLLAQKAAIGACHKQYFVDIAAALGFEIEIEEYRPFWVGIGKVGEPLGGQSVLFNWKVWVKIPAGGDDDILSLQTIYTKVKPAHTAVHYGIIYT
ncbi:MAG: DUF2313 domain-containing protein [bacterium]|nr:DUF2313 domain-containing protein [bacterium]